MSDETPAVKSGKIAKADAATPAGDATTNGDATSVDAVGEPAGATPPVEPSESTAVDPAAATAAEPSPNATGEVAQVTGQAVGGATSEPAAQQVVYVQAPIPPKVRGNRVVGVLLALLGTVIFAAVYAGAAAIPLVLRYSGQGFSPAFSAFVQSAFFWVPIMMFAVGFVLLTLILNRSGWWAHVMGSLIVAVFVYFASIGLLLLVGNVISMTPAQATTAFGALATNPLMIAAALVAREVSIWMGLAIAARGRRVKARNVESRAAFDREQAEKRAQYGTAAPV